MGRWSGWTLWACLALGLGLAAWAVSVRDPLPAGAPADAFSAGRAMADVRVVGGEAHPMGSPANDRVRDALLARMQALGLDPQVREGIGLDTPRFAPNQLNAGVVRNVLGVLPGSDRTLPAVLLMAHFDSVPNSPGAADDAAGVASALEIMRLLKATGPHRRDVMVLLTDGEEAGLLGADAFFSGDPLRARVGAVVNLETRGDAGRAAMFETGRDNAGMIALYAAHARAPFANSLTSFLYHQLPNNTDFTHAYRAGLPGLNFAFTGDQLAYHTPLATPGHLSQQSLQHMGDQVAPAVRALADAAALPARGPDRVYFDLFGRGVVNYPPASGWWVWGGGLGLLVLAFAGARRGRDERGPGLVADTVRGAAAALAATTAAALAGHAAGRWLDGAGYAAGYHLYRAYDLLFVGAGLLALGAALLVYAGAGRGRGLLGIGGVAVGTALFTLIHGFDAFAWGLAAATVVGAAVATRRAVTPAGAWLGALVLVGAVAGALQALAPLVAPLAAWPFLLGALAAALRALAPRGLRFVASMVAFALAVVTVGALGALAEGLFTALGPAMPEVLAVFVLLFLAALAPWAAAWGGGRWRGATAVAALAMGVCAVLAVGLGRASVSRPGLADALFLARAEGAPLRVAPIPHLDPWSRAVLGADGGAIAPAPVAPLFPYPVFQAPATARAVPPPVVRLERTGGGVTLTAQATGGGRVLRMFVRSSGGLDHVGVDGRSSPLVAVVDQWAAVEFAAPPRAGVVVTFVTPLGARVEARVFEQRDGWPAGAEPVPKPPPLMAWRDSDTTLVEARGALP